MARVRLLLATSVVVILVLAATQCAYAFSIGFSRNYDDSDNGPSRLMAQAVQQMQMQQQQMERDVLQFMYAQEERVASSSMENAVISQIMNQVSRALAGSAIVSSTSTSTSTSTSSMRGGEDDDESVTVLVIEREMPRTWSPAVDASETATAIRMDVELPGVHPADIDVVIFQATPEANEISIRGVARNHDSLSSLPETAARVPVSIINAVAPEQDAMHEEEDDNDDVEFVQEEEEIETAEGWNEIVIIEDVQRADVNTDSEVVATPQQRLSAVGAAVPAQIFQQLYANINNNNARAPGQQQEEEEAEEPVVPILPPLPPPPMLPGGQWIPTEDAMNGQRKKRDEVVDEELVDYSDDDGKLISHPVAQVQEAREWVHTERMRGAFERRFRLPPYCDIHQAEAVLSRGVLYITIPKITQSI